MRQEKWVNQIRRALSEGKIMLLLGFRELLNDTPVHGPRS